MRMPDDRPVPIPPVVDGSSPPPTDAHADEKLEAYHHTILHFGGTRRWRWTCGDRSTIACAMRSQPWGSTGRSRC